MHAFLLGRDGALSVAELFAVFPEARFSFLDRKIAYIEGYSDDEILKAFPFMGGVIKVVRIDHDCAFADIPAHCVEAIAAVPIESKVSYAIAAYGMDLDTEKFGLRLKKDIKPTGKSIRFVMGDRGANISSATFLHSGVKDKGIELNIFQVGNDRYLLGTTLAVQDIDSYAKRDMERTRDMAVGMLPPKLCQMLINIAKPAHTVYDPFCGLGTVLVEASNMGYRVAASDLSPAMVEATKANLRDWTETAVVFELDARRMDLAFGPGKVSKDATIISEGYLGNIATKSVSDEKFVAEQKSTLLGIYEWFIKSLVKSGFHSTAVFCLPFWELRGKKYFMTEFHKFLDRQGIKSEIDMPKGSDNPFTLSPYDTLLYKRPGQQVGREIVRIKF